MAKTSPGLPGYKAGALAITNLGIHCDKHKDGFFFISFNVPSRSKRIYEF